MYNQTNIDYFVHQCFLGNIDEVRMLLDNGIHPDSVSTQGQSSLIAAINGENLEIIELLVTYGVDVNKGSWTPLHELIDLSIDSLNQNEDKIITPTYFKMLFVLLENEADLSKANEYGDSPLKVLKTYSSSSESLEDIKDYFRNEIPDIDRLLD